LEAAAQRIDALEDVVLARNNGAGEAALAERLAALERQLAGERNERLSALSSLAADLKGIVDALGCNAADGTNQPSLVDRLQMLAADLERDRLELVESLGGRIAAMESAASSQADKGALDLSNMQEAVGKLSMNHQLLAGSMDQWRSSDAEQ